MAHVFIVNPNTLKYHLNYLFAGTGAKNLKINFLQNQTNNNIKSEKLLCGMLADISRIREGDKILFYLQATKDTEGEFFGSFKATSRAFIDNDNYPKELGKYKFLPFRIRIEPDEVYSKGATERNCLDSLKGIEHPYQLCWSLIYRKLRANRGCTMITDYEYESIMKKIRSVNNNTKIISKSFSFDKKNNIIVASTEKFDYEGQKEETNILNRLLYKFEYRSAFETHLQAYIMQNLEKDCCSTIRKKDLPISWIGNEVSCGVGMQSIDCMFIQKDVSKVYINVCELKYGSILKEQKLGEQVSKYIEWIQDYISPIYYNKNKKVEIIPIIIAQKGKKEKKYQEELKSIRKVKEKISNQTHLTNLRYIDFTSENNNLVFHEEDIN